MKNKDNEFRAITTELRVDADNTGTITGYAAVFNSLSQDLGGFRETIQAGAFAESIKSADVRALIDHDGSKILGRNKAGTLTMVEDSHGLKIEITPPDTTAGRDIMESLKRGDVDGMSFGFRTITDDWNTQDGEQIRTLINVDLFDISVVTFPAYQSTEVKVALRSLDMFNESRSDENETEENDDDDSNAEQAVVVYLENMKRRCIMALKYKNHLALYRRDNLKRNCLYTE